MNRFIDERKDNWQRLEDLLEMLRGSSLRYLSKIEVREFGELYRRAATDLAIARSETRDPKLINYLNSLVIRAHGKVYRSEGEGVGIIRHFFGREMPQVFRANWRYMAFSGAIFFVFVALGFIASARDPEFTHFVGLSGVNEHISSNFYWWKDLNDANQIGASFILSNNILVTFRAFAMGALFGIGAVYDIAFFGAHVGSVFGACYNLNPPFAGELGSFVVAHGVVEISTVFFCGGAGMMIGYSLIDPGDLPRSQALKKKGIQAMKIVLGSACFLVVAGIIEGFISPSSLPVGVKISVGVLSGALMFGYLALAGRDASTVEV